MRKIDTYDIVTAQNHIALEERVNRLIVAGIGWEPIGGVSVAYDQYARDLVWSQAMVHYDDRLP